MYNYSKNNVSINKAVYELITRFNEVARQLATESCEHTTTKKTLAESLENAVKDGKTEEAQTIQQKIDDLEDAWTKRRKVLEFMLFGGKADDGTKVDGICSLVTDDLYKSYTAFVKDGKTGDYRDNMRTFCESIINQDTMKDGAFNHLYNDLLITMSSTKYNSNSQIAKGAAFITTINKRTYKKMLLGALCDIIDNNKTLKVKNPPKAEK